MIGNDIVDLKAAASQSNWQRRGFLNKLFSEKEQEIIFNSSSPGVQVWILWAMKEAAYKAHQRVFNLPRSFCPQSQKCDLFFQDLTSASGEVVIGTNKYNTEISISKNAVHCIATNLQQNDIFSGIFPSSASIKLEVISKISLLKNIPTNHFSIKKNSHHIPHLACDEQIIEWPFSLSHHGNFSAYVLALRNY